MEISKFNRNTFSEHCRLYGGHFFGFLEKKTQRRTSFSRELQSKKLRISRPYSAPPQKNNPETCLVDYPLCWYDFSIFLIMDFVKKVRADFSMEICIQRPSKLLSHRGRIVIYKNKYSTKNHPSRKTHIFQVTFINLRETKHIILKGCLSVTGQH